MSNPSPAPQITIRHCTTIAEYDQCVRVEHATWGPEISVPNGMFIVAHHTGGQVFAAYDSTEMIGFTLAVVGVRKFGPHSGQTTTNGKYTPFIHSHLTAVLDNYRNHGIGRRLKLFQRQDALDRGFPLVEWTFDPLEVKNGYFNIARLGVVVRRYIPNCYGITASPLHSGIPTDRFVPEWWIDSDRVRRVTDGHPLPHGKIADRISLPRHIGEIKTNDPDLAIRIQSEFRTRCERAFASGLVISGVDLGDQTVDYVLQPDHAIPGLSLPALVQDEPGAMW
jgi:predicted GNAT superfamily acetyltransferase